ncbi:MAG: hypothetical protein ACTSYS_14030 [Promethearchaeota archaeon]
MFKPIFLYKDPEIYEYDDVFSYHEIEYFHPGRLLRYLMPDLIGFTNEILIDKNDGISIEYNAIKVICPVCQYEEVLINFREDGVYDCRFKNEIDPTVPSACESCSIPLGEKISKICYNCDHYMPGHPCDYCYKTGFGKKSKEKDIKNQRRKDGENYTW